MTAIKYVIVKRKNDEVTLTLIKPTVSITNTN